MRNLELLMSLPPAMADFINHNRSSDSPIGFAGSDPAGQHLGSGGGAAHLLEQAWRATGPALTFQEWMRGSSKLVLHGGGQSRRLPAYAPVGKPFIPIPALRRAYGQRLDQTLQDFQVQVYQQVFQRASNTYVLMITSGDVALRFGRLPEEMPEADVLAFGMPGEPEVAQQFGVFFSEHGSINEVAFFLQKPDAGRIRELAGSHDYLLDTGMWLLSERAAAVLMSRSGWQCEEECFRNGIANRFELYAGFGTALGSSPAWNAEDINSLTCAVVSLPRPEFFHLGTSRQLIESVTRMQNSGNSASFVQSGFAYHPDQFIQNSLVRAAISRIENHTLWIENSQVPKSWELTNGHILTGVPENSWILRLEPNVCIDFVPIGEEEYCIRTYGLDDSFAGPLCDSVTNWCGRQAAEWFQARGITLAAAQLDPSCDIQTSCLFPVVTQDDLSSEFIQWMVDTDPASDECMTSRWLRLRRLSAQQLASCANVQRLQSQRDANRLEIIPKLHANHDGSVFFRLDLDSVAASLARAGSLLPPELSTNRAVSPITSIKAEMFRSSALRRVGIAEWERHEANAFSQLRRAIIETRELMVSPVRNVLDDQIVWGRSPIRLDLAGGWTDTPPYCIEHGGRVVNLAVNLNGQPPVQVFARPAEARELVIRSIDLGKETRIGSYEELSRYTDPRDEFALAKAALALAGFLPQFHKGREFGSLEQQLEAFGGGIEVTLLAATPKGSGLGTSSILSSTLLATLSMLCGLGWDNHELVHLTLVLEQIVTTGGGWQDQAGGIHKGLKMLVSAPGMEQRLSVRWLPEHLFGADETSRLMLLYYTGITRMAKGILQEVVRGMFLNRAEVLETVAAIGDNAETAFQAIQTGDYPALCASVRMSWELNKLLDSGTNPTEVQQILDVVEADVAAVKLLGAGGGGYLLMFARDEESAKRIRRKLNESAPNSLARFVDFEISDTGLQVTRS